MVDRTTFPSAAWHSLTAEQVMATLETSAHGLSSVEAQARLRASWRPRCHWSASRTSLTRCSNRRAMLRRRSASKQWLVMLALVVAGTFWLEVVKWARLWWARGAAVHET